ncbi:hypothetical protein NIES4103_17490 [Nostoc sp. NIES-4103]|nr:hypothetical protein NIES4103_17490 [Nostoc sp. NIES-4103]
MKIKTVLLSAALASVTFFAASNIVQAQDCPRNVVVPASVQTRIIRQEKFGYRLRIPNNYRTMTRSGNVLLIFDPNSFAEAQCLIKNQAPTELPKSISIYVKSVNSQNQSLANLIKKDDPTADKFENIKVANRTAVSYISSTLGVNQNVSLFTPNRKYIITISAPFNFKEGRPTTIFNKKVFDQVLSSLTFIR